MRHKKLLLLLGKKVIFFNYLVKKISLENMVNEFL